MGITRNPETVEATTGQINPENTKRTDSGINQQASVSHHTGPSTRDISVPNSLMDNGHMTEGDAQEERTHHLAPPLTHAAIKSITDDPFSPTFDPAEVAEHSQRIASFWPYPTSKAMKEFPEFCKIYCIIKSFNLPNALPR